LETTAIFYEMPFKAADTPTRAVYGLPSSKGIAVYRQKVKLLKDRLSEIDTMRRSGGAPKAIEQEQDQVRTELSRARQMLVVLTLGVPLSELEFNSYSSQRQYGRINITGQADPRSPGGSHGPIPQQGEVDFKPGMKSAVQIDFSQFELEDPTRAQSVLFHEVEHLGDYELAQNWVQRYERETGRVFVSGPPGRDAFAGWMMAQAPVRLSNADAELVVEEAADVSGATEARANVHTFLAALHAGAFERAIKDLVGYANALPPGKQYANPAPGSMAALTTELQTTYQQMPREMQLQFHAALAAAKQANPSAWVSNVHFAK